MGHQISFLVLYGHFTVLFSVLWVAKHQCFRAGAGNCLRLGVTLGFYLCLVGQIHVKNANSKLKWRVRGPMLPPSGLEPLCGTVLVEKVTKKTGGGARGWGKIQLPGHFPTDLTWMSFHLFWHELTLR